MPKFFKKFEATDKMQLEVPFECKQVTEDAEGYYFEGYASVFGVIDEDEDIIAKGAYAESLTKRMPKVLGHHDVYMPVGVTVEAKEDDYGLWVKGFIPKDGGNTPFIVPYLKIGAIDSLSVGFMISRDSDGRPMYDIINGIRVINKIELYEYSFVVFPANQLAKVTLSGEKSSDLDDELLKALNECLTVGEPTETDGKFLLNVKFDNERFDALKKSLGTDDNAGSTARADLPLAELSVPWDTTGFFDRIKGVPQEQLAKGFVEVGGAKIYFCDVVDGELKAIPRAVMSAAKVMEVWAGGEGYKEARNRLAHYYVKMGMEVPFNDSTEQLRAVAEGLGDIKDLKGMATLLKFHGFSNKDYNTLVAKFKTLLGSRKDDPSTAPEGDDSRKEEESMARMEQQLDEFLSKGIDQKVDAILSHFPE